MRGIPNRKKIYDQIPLLATGKVNFIPVFSEKGVIGDIYCNRVEYGEYNRVYSRNISEDNIPDVNWAHY